MVCLESRRRVGPLMHTTTFYVHSCVAAGDTFAGEVPQEKSVVKVFKRSESLELRNRRKRLCLVDVEA